MDQVNLIAQIGSWIFVLFFFFFLIISLLDTETQEHREVRDIYSDL